MAKKMSELLSCTLDQLEGELVRCLDALNVSGSFLTGRSHAVEDVTMLNAAINLKLLQDRRLIIAAEEEKINRSISTQRGKDSIMDRWMDSHD